MRIGMIATFAAFAAACTTQQGEPVEVAEQQTADQQVAVASGSEPTPVALPLGQAAGLSSLDQTVEGKAFPKNAANTTALDRKWKFELYATPATGQTGIAKITADGTFKKHTEKKPSSGASIPSDSRCPAARKWGANLVSLTWVQEYQDGQGSSLEGKAKNPSGTAVCTNGRAFRIEVNGEITKGKGKFKDVKSGDWNATVNVDEICNPKGGWCPVSGTLDVTDLKYK